ncbi:MAG: PRD domain-containing protein [Propionibacteriaceae bacterium]|nr:PRD domain-containing protein [Propionibacteriaceae bacterium]
MKILRVFNNNLVLAREPGGDEVILTGRGLGFQAKPGQEVDPAKVVRRFVPSDGRDPDHLAALLAGIPPEHIHLVSVALAEAGVTPTASGGATTLVIALADHLNFAVHRVESGLEVAYPLVAEVTNLYAGEYAQAQAVLASLNQRLDTPLPESEAVAIALHLVNAGMATGDLSYTYTMTGVIQQMVAVIEQSYGVALPSTSVSVGRLITHLRYLFVRIHQHSQLDEGRSAIGAAIRDAYPQALECALRLAQVVELRLDAALTDDEVSYLTLHVARVVQDCPAP